MTPLPFVHDPALDQELGAPLVELLTGAVEAEGDCVACGRTLGSEGRFRLAAQITETTALVAALHAACGGGVQETTFLSVPPGTWLAGVFGARMTVVLPRKRGLFARSPKPEEWVLPAVAIKPSCDVFALSRNEEGSFRDPLDRFRADGFIALQDGLVMDRPPHDPDSPVVTLTDDGLLVSEMETYSAPLGQDRVQAARLISEAGGVVLAVTLSEIPRADRPGSDIAVMRDGRSLFKWVPTDDIIGL
jgi:hypothetical protein